MEQPQKYPNQKRDLITTYRERYGQYLTEAHVSVEHTATEGWRKLYSAFRAEEQTTRRKLGGEIKALGRTMEDFGLSESEEKLLKEIIKESQELQGRHDAFERDTVGPVRQAVVECEKLRNDAIREANRTEAEAPLIHVGLAELMRMEVAGWDRPEWDADEGTVTIGKLAKATE